MTKEEPPVVICGKRYVFGATANGSVSASAACPALHRDEDVESAVAEKESTDQTKVAELVASGVKAIRTVYADGGQNPVFAGYKDTSDPEALASGPEEIVLENHVKTTPAAVKVATADGAKQRAAFTAHAPAPVAAAATAPAEPAAELQPQTVALASTAPPDGGVAGMWGASTQTMKKWLHLGGQEPVQPAATAHVPEQPAAPLPPRRDAAVGKSEKPVRVALHAAALPPVKPDAASSTAPTADAAAAQ